MAVKNREVEIQKLMTKLNLTRAEAEEVYLFDQEETTNEIADALTEKAKSAEKASGKKESSIVKVNNLKAKKKTDTRKEGFIAHVLNMVKALKAAGEVNSYVEMTSTKISFQDSDGNYYTLALTKHKQMPDGYVVKED